MRPAPPRASAPDRPAARVRRIDLSPLSGDVRPLCLAFAPAFLRPRWVGTSTAAQSKRHAAHTGIRICLTAGEHGTSVSSTPARWLLQDWGLANSRPEHPCTAWAAAQPGRRTADYPVLPRGQTEMPFLMQLDGGGRLPTSERRSVERGWTNAYAFWCDACSLSAILHQQS